MKYTELQSTTNELKSDDYPEELSKLSYLLALTIPFYLALVTFGLCILAYAPIVESTEADTQQISQVAKQNAPALSKTVYNKTSQRFKQSDAHMQKASYGPVLSAADNMVDDQAHLGVLAKVVPTLFDRHDKVIHSDGYGSRSDSDNQADHGVQPEHASQGLNAFRLQRADDAVVNNSDEDVSGSMSRFGLSGQYSLVSIEGFRLFSTVNWSASKANVQKFMLPASALSANSLRRNVLALPASKEYAQLHDYFDSIIGVRNHVLMGREIENDTASFGLHLTPMQGFGIDTTGRENMFTLSASDDFSDPMSRFGLRNNVWQHVNTTEAKDADMTSTTLKLEGLESDSQMPENVSTLSMHSKRTPATVHESSSASEDKVAENRDWNLLDYGSFYWRLRVHEDVL